MSLIHPRSHLVRCANRHCRSMVLSGDSRCARCGSGQTPQAPLRAQARLRHCSNRACRAFILDSDTRCAHCGCEAPAFKAFRFGVTMMGRAAQVGAAVGILLLLALWVLKFDKARFDPESPAVHAPAPGTPTGQDSRDTDR